MSILSQPQFHRSHPSTVHTVSHFHSCPGFIHRLSHQVSLHAQYIIILFLSLRATCPALPILLLFFNIRLTFVSLFCMFAFYFAYSVSLYCFAYCFSCCIYAAVCFIFLHKFTDHCHRVQTKFRLISIISYIISNHIISYYVP